MLREEAPLERRGQRRGERSERGPKASRKRVRSRTTNADSDSRSSGASRVVRMRRGENGRLETSGQASGIEHGLRAARSSI